MKISTTHKTWLGALAALLLTVGGTAAQAQVRITEVAPWSSGSSVGADWFELTNTGSSALALSGWKMDDNSFAFGSAVALSGITTLAAGESVIFLEGGATEVNNFVSGWFGGVLPAGLQIGTYSGAGVGLSTSGDGVAVFNAAGVLQAKVSFGASDATAPLQTFDNAQGLDNATISLFSVLGTNGAFASPDGAMIGSPGAIAAVPEPASCALLLGGLSAVGLVARRRANGKA